MGNKALMLGVFLAYTTTTELQVSIICLEMLVTRKVCYFVLIFLQFVKKLLTGVVSEAVVLCCVFKGKKSELFGCEDLFALD